MLPRDSSIGDGPVPAGKAGSWLGLGGQQGFFQGRRAARAKCPIRVVKGLAHHQAPGRASDCRIRCQAAGPPWRLTNRAGAYRQVRSAHHCGSDPLVPQKVSRQRSPEGPTPAPRLCGFQPGGQGQACMSPAVEDSVMYRSLETGCGAPSGRQAECECCALPTFHTQPVAVPCRPERWLHQPRGDPRCCFAATNARSTTHGDDACGGPVRPTPAWKSCRFVTAFDRGLSIERCFALETTQSRQFAGGAGSPGSCRAWCSARQPCFRTPPAFAAAVYGRLDLAARLRRTPFCSGARGWGPLSSSVAAPVGPALLFPLCRAIPAGAKPALSAAGLKLGPQGDVAADPVLVRCRPGVAGGWLGRLCSAGDPAFLTGGPPVEPAAGGLWIAWRQRCERQVIWLPLPPRSRSRRLLSPGSRGPRAETAAAAQRRAPDAITCCCFRPVQVALGLGVAMRAAWPVLRARPAPPAWRSVTTPKVLPQPVHRLPLPGSWTRL